MAYDFHCKKGEQRYPRMLILGCVNGNFKKLPCMLRNRQQDLSNRDYKTQESSKCKKPKEERDETSLNEEPVKPSNLKTQ